jgi:transposase
MDTEGTLHMSREEARRLSLVQQVLDRRMRQRHAADVVGVSVRQVRRWVQRVRSAGPAGLVHRLRGRPSNRRSSAKLKQRVLARYRERYLGFGPTLACEKLQERDRLLVSRETLRQWLLEAGCWQRQRKPAPPHVWRERKAARGEMVQLDGSHHDWLEGRGPKLVLMAYIDDATSEVFARFYDYEGTMPAFESFYGYAIRHGLPQSVYCDRHAAYWSRAKPSLEDDLAGREGPQTQFERALTQLGVEVIWAGSPQAKGRVERLFRTFQDRLIKELRLAGITSREAANRFLQRYLPTYNRRFSCAPRVSTDLHQPAPAPSRLRRILARHTLRTLRQDNTLQYQGQWYVLTQPWRTRRPKQVTVVEQVDGTRLLCHGEQVLAHREIAPRPPAAAPRFPWPSRHRAVVIPNAEHPWRSDSFLRSRRARELVQALERGAVNHHDTKEDSSTLQERGHF